MRQLAITLSILLAATAAFGWRLTSTTTLKHRYEGMQIEVNDLSDVGVVVHSPAGTGFSNMLSSLLTVPSDLAGDAAKYSVVIENKTPQHINAIAVIWRFYPSQGKPIERKYSFSFLGNSFFNNASDSLIKPGELYPLCLFAESAGFGRERLRELKSDQQTTNTLSVLNSLLARSTRWSLTIDSVLFSNGVWVGPNTDGFVERLTAQINGARDLLKELAQKLDAGEPVGNLLAHARAYAGAPNEKPEQRMPDRRQITNPNYLYDWAKKNTARQVLARHERFGGDQAMIEWVREHMRRQISLVKR